MFWVAVEGLAPKAVRLARMEVQGGVLDSEGANDLRLRRRLLALGLALFHRSRGFEILRLVAHPLVGSPETVVIVVLHEDGALHLGEDRLLHHAKLTLAIRRTLAN